MQRSSMHPWHRLLRLYSNGFVASIDRGPQVRNVILDMKGEAVSIGVDFSEAQKVADTVYGALSPDGLQQVTAYVAAMNPR